MSGEQFDNHPGGELADLLLRPAVVWTAYEESRCVNILTGRPGLPASYYNALTDNLLNYAAIVAERHPMYLNESIEFLTRIMDDPRMSGENRSRALVFIATHG